MCEHPRRPHSDGVDLGVKLVTDCSTASSTLSSLSSELEETGDGIVDEIRFRMTGNAGHCSRTSCN